MGENLKVWGSFENASSAMARRLLAVGIDSTDKLPCQRLALSLGDPSRIINFGQPESHREQLQSDGGLFPIGNYEPESRCPPDIHSPD